MRPTVWIPAAFAVVLALGIAASTLGPLGEGSRPAPVRVSLASAPHAAPHAAAPRRPSAGASAPEVASAPPRGSAPASRAATARPAATPPTAASRGASAPAEKSRPAPAAAQPKDPELARHLYVAESDAAQQAIGLGLVTPEQLDAAAGGTPSGGETSANGSSSSSGAARRTASDALLEEYLLRKEYQGISFPEGFPAAKEMRSTVQARIGNLDAQDRLTLLNDALQSMGSLPQQPQFYSVPPALRGASGG